MILPYRGRGNFLIKGGPCGAELCPALCPVPSDMEMHQGRRPVYGGAARQERIKKPRNDTVRGVQGSRGPLVGGRRIERGEALERLCREIAQRCADGRSVKRARSSVSGRRTGGQCKRAGAWPYLHTVMKEQR